MDQFSQLCPRHNKIYSVGKLTLKCSLGEQNKFGRGEGGFFNGSIRIKSDVTMTFGAIF